MKNPHSQPHLAKACLPVPAFGNIASDTVEVVTVGLNPALNEFVQEGLIIADRTQRLPTLQDYDVSDRSLLNEANLQEARTRREKYFSDVDRNWHSYFDKMEMILSRIEPRWTYVTGLAAHVDLVACATLQRWGKLPLECQAEMARSCRDHFLHSLSTIRDGTLLLLDGSRVVKEVEGSGIGIEETPGDRIINARWNTFHRGWIGKLHVGTKVFPFRGWPTPAGKLTSVWRHDLAFWVNWTLRPAHEWRAGKSLKSK